MFYHYPRCLEALDSEMHVYQSGTTQIIIVVFFDTKILKNSLINYDGRNLSNRIFEGVYSKNNYQPKENEWIYILLNIAKLNFVPV